MTANTKKIRTLIVDDESLARRTIRDLLADDPQIEIIGECGSGLEAVNFIREQPPDLLFLDIQMPGMNGFDALSRIEVERIPAIIFVTAFDHYALKAFEVHALDYLLKPFSDQRFEEALKQAKSHIEMREINRLSQSLLTLLGERAGSEAVEVKRKSFLTRFMIRSSGRVAFIKATDVDWIAADDYYIKLHVGNKSHLLRLSMNELEEKLDPKSFLRIHRSTIINFERVKELQQHPNGEYVVVLKDGTELKLSRSRRERLEQLLTNS
ncbi:MAG TPA: LytTR family DNA-binding domain-containing protein [Pyrinomonadaceae bacterium]|jgi:two-component system LytT family response regulator